MILEYLDQHNHRAAGGMEQQQQQQQLMAEQTALLIKGSDELSSLGGLGLQPKLTLSVEGNISAGKSTFLQILKESGIEQHLQVGCHEESGGIRASSCECMQFPEVAGRNLII